MGFFTDRFMLPFTKVFGAKKRANSCKSKVNNNYQTNQMKKKLLKVDTFGQKCNYVATIWLWATVIAVVYCGFEHVLPAVLGQENKFWINANKCYCSFILIEMILNWAFMKFVKSPFKASEHQEFLHKHADEVQNGGFEMNMNELRRGGETGQEFTIPKSSLYSSVRDPKLLKGTLYVVDAAEARTSLRQDVHIDDAIDANGSRKLVFPYWSWKPCIICQTPRPPRTHHCPICGTCVLKRDHHCFFTGSCVGLRNQRYFVVFTFWGSVATLYCVFLSFAYLALVHVPENTWWDMVWPILIIRYVIGYVTLFDVALLTLLYFIGWFCLTACAFFREQFLCIMRGITSFEQDNGIKIANTFEKQRNLRGVFGKYWYLNFLIPMHFVFPQQDDGITWENIKAI